MQRRFTVILASVILLISLTVIARRLWQPVPRIDSTRFIGLGQVLADETVKAINDHGRIVVVTHELNQLPGSPVRDEFESFQTRLKQHSAISLLATEIVSNGPEAMVLGAGCSRNQLQAIFDQYASADAIVFLINLPEWQSLQVRGFTPPPGTVKILVALPGAVPVKSEYGGYFAKGLLTVLIGARAVPDATQSANPHSPREWFDQYYQIYTPENYDSLPD